MREFAAQASSKCSEPEYLGVKKSIITIPVRDKSEIRALLYQPENVSAGTSPLVLLLHPGGFCMGEPEIEEQLALELVRTYGVVSLVPSYRLAPEFPFPIGLQDAYDAVEWAATHASELNANPEKGFIVGGDSAGANLSAVISHLARDNSLAPPLTGVWLNSPITIAPSALSGRYLTEHKSHKQNANSPLFSAEDFEHMFQLYRAVPTDPRFSPLLWPGGHKGLPPHVIQTAGLDMLRDDALLYERDLRDQGIETRIHVYPGVTHAFDNLFPQLRITARFKKERARGFAWLLKRS
ncbi:Alpha/Beta hydrolase protein [Aspergillus navahoensis]